MKKCRVCGVRLDGLFGKIRGLFFKQHASDKDQNICSRCIKDIDSHPSERKTDEPVAKEDEKYQCPVCKRMIHQSHALEHIKTEEYLMKLISEDHPKWGKEEPVCKECIDYYRKLVEDAEI